MRSGGSSIISFTASCRFWVAEQIVSKLRKRSVISSGPQRSTTASPSSAAMASDSEASIVVWLATPTFPRWRSGSNPSDTDSANASMKEARSPSPRIYAQTSRACSMSRTMRNFPFSCFRTWELVARVSSCQCLPWMIEVNPSRA